MLQPPNNTNYEDLPKVKVRIHSVKPSLVVVRMDDGSRGIIPRREWTWDRSEKPDTSRWVEGSVHEAVLISPPNASGYPQLSFKALKDPWESAKDILKMGKTLRGEVVNIRRDAIYIQLKPGIDAVNWAADLPLFSHQLPSDIFCIGDQVLAKITHLDFEKRQVAVSINDCLRSAEIAPDKQLEHLNWMFEQRIEEMKSNIPKVNPEEIVVINDHEVPPLTYLRQVLVIDDNLEDQNAIVRMLSRLEVVLEVKTSGRAAIDWLRNGNNADLIVLDINLSDGEFGPEIAKQIFNEFGFKHIIFTSRDPHNILTFRQLEEEWKVKFPFFTKLATSIIPNKQESLVEMIQLLHNGIVHRDKSIVARNQNAFIDQLEMQTLLKMPFEEAVEEMLHDVARTTFVQHAIVLEFDDLQRAFKIIAAWPEHKYNEYKLGLNDLYFSQAQSVIEEEEVLYASAITPEEKAVRFRNFFPNIHFRSCYGVPIRRQGHPVRHGLFILNNTPDLTWETILHIRTAASHCAVLIERDMMLRMMQQYEDRYFKGQLFGTFLHEFRNHLHSFTGNIEASEAFQATDPQSDDLKDSIAGLKEGLTEMNNLIGSYTRMLKDDMDDIDLNTVVEKVQKQLGYMAKEENAIALVLERDPNTPPIKANPLRIEQVVSNIVLNAIQHVAIQNKQYRDLNATHGYDQPLMACNTIVIRTCFCESTNLCRIAVMDTGPGVAFDRHQKIFRPGESSRMDGQGLGLFVSRNLAEAMQGELILADSIRFGGSIFVVSFPSSRPISPNN